MLKNIPDVVISMSYPWDMTQNGGFVNGYGFPDGDLAASSAAMIRLARPRRPGLIRDPELLVTSGGPGPFRLAGGNRHVDRGRD